MDKKYYWYSYSYTYTEFAADIPKFSNDVTTNHPFDEMKEINKDSPGYYGPKMSYVLLNWREITEEDYNLFKKMENE